MTKNFQKSTGSFGKKDVITILDQKKNLLK